MVSVLIIILGVLAAGFLAAAFLPKGQLKSFGEGIGEVGTGLTTLIGAPFAGPLIGIGTGLESITGPVREFVDFWRELIELMIKLFSGQLPIGDVGGVADDVISIQAPTLPLVGDIAEIELPSLPDFRRFLTADWAQDQPFLEEVLTKSGWEG